MTDSSLITRENSGAIRTLTARGITFAFNLTFGEAANQWFPKSAAGAANPARQTGIPVCEWPTRPSHAREADRQIRCPAVRAVAL